MLSNNEFRQHRFAILLYIAYFLSWTLFAASIIRINLNQVRSGDIFCGDGVIVVYYLLLPLSSIYLVSTLFAVLSSTNKKFYLRLAFAIFLPVLIAYLWKCTW